MSALFAKYEIDHNHVFVLVLLILMRCVVDFFFRYTVLAIINLICAVMVIIGTFQCLGGAVSSQGSLVFWFYIISHYFPNCFISLQYAGAALVFLGLIFATIFGVALFFPNHELVEADNDVASAIHYTKLHPPVERDSFYVVTPDVLEAWRDRPESWSFEVAPWGPTVIEQVDAVAILDDIELFPMPFMMPLVDQDQDAYNAEIARMEGIAAGRIDADVALTEGDLNKASLANMNAMQLQEAAYKQRLKADQVHFF
jgi:hypothetical protein